jgi:hypothetical protein
VRGRLSLRGAALLAAAGGAIAIAIAIVLMVRQPATNAAAAVPQKVQQQVLRDSPQLGYLPTRLPSGVKYSSRYEHGYQLESPNDAFALTFTRSDGRMPALVFRVNRQRCVTPASGEAAGTEVSNVDGHQVGWIGDDHQMAFRCVSEDTLVSAHGDGFDRSDLETVVASAELFR